MYSKTVGEIQTEILNNIPDTYQKTVGFEMWDFSRACATVISGLSSDLDVVYGKNDVDNLSGDELEKWVFQRKGLTRKPATFATATLHIIGTFEIKAGDIFETAGGIQFKAIADTTSSPVQVQCLIAGALGNVIADSITLMPVTIAGIISVTNPLAATGGYEAESDDSLRERYYEVCQAPPTSGNVYHYKIWSKEITGVGDAKVFPLAFGVNTVEIVIVDSNKEPASNDLVEQVQDYIDPDISGRGEGQAPIGAYCTVNPATAKNIDVSCKIKLDGTCTLEEATANINTAIVKYNASIAFKSDFVSFAHVGSYILSSAGVDDYSDLTINTGVSNIILADREVPVLNNLVVTEDV
jgi:uncharacterized phage protein gp47/JayE